MKITEGDENQNKAFQHYLRLITISQQYFLNRAMCAKNNMTLYSFNAFALKLNHNSPSSDSVLKAKITFVAT